jgi:hypothetical protein
VVREGGLAKRRRSQGDDSSVLRYLRSIDTKLDRLNERLDKLSAPPKKTSPVRASALWQQATRRKEADELQKNNPDDDVI